MARLTLALLAASLAIVASAEEPGFKVIVNRSNSTDAITTERLQALFLKTSTKWPGGATVEPAEVRGEAPARREFARRVLGKSLPALKAHWNKLIFAGREVPPVELGSDEEVVSFVKTHEGAIGVVSGSAATAGTKVVAVKD